jgi:hypothetical protein
MTMAVVYSDTTLARYCVNNAEQPAWLLGSLAEPLDVSHGFAFIENTVFMKTLSFPHRVRYNEYKPYA